MFLALNLIKTSLRDMVRVDSVFIDRSLIHPALRQFGEECRAIMVRLMAYVGGLAALAMIAADLLSGVPQLVAAPPAPMANGVWTRDVRPRPAFSVVSVDFPDKTASYEILRHPQGGRKDILRWGASETAPVASFVLYRRAGEADADGAVTDDLALGEIAALVPGSVQPFGVIDTKFGPVRLLGATEAKGGHQCLGLMRAFSEPDLRLSGLFCSGDSAPVARSQVVCGVNRLTLLGAGSNSRLAELFARADLRGADCKSSPSASGDWMSAMVDPKLRGPL